MRVPLSWLREFTPVEGDPSDLAHTLSDLGLVVEGVERLGEELRDVVVARVVELREHPDADNVQLVDVDAGDGSPLQVVCGAFNFGPGDLVPLARQGTRLPGGMEIGRRRVRGQWSEGMLCSAAELGLSEDHWGIFLVPPGAEPGTPLVEALGLRRDVVFDLDISPNRPDALSVAGVARDLAAKLGLPFTLPELPDTKEASPGRFGVAVESLDLCPRFTGTLVDHVVVAPPPTWLARRLTMAGMRSINNVVDISNYVMLELGHPNHPYDLDRLPGHGLLVRRGRPDERLVTLDGTERELGPDDCVIADAEGTGVGIGGIMGGASSEISDDTTRVLLEVAYFSPTAVARTSKRLGLRTEASVRFERGVDPEGLERAVARFWQLLGRQARAALNRGTTDVRGAVPERSVVRVRTGRVNALLGTALSPEQVSGYLEPIGFACSPAGADDFDVTIPSWRPDSEREVDVIEEVARLHGYSAIAQTVPVVRGVGGLRPDQRERRLVRQILVGCGLSEAWTSSFLAPDDLQRAGLPTEAVEVENPLGVEESILRTSLLPGLLRALRTNASHRYPEVSLFEVGNVFLPPPDGAELPDERERVAAILGRRDAAEAKGVLDILLGGLRLEGVTLEPGPVAGLHPTRAARLVAGGRHLGVLGEVAPEVLEAHDLEGPAGWFELERAALSAAPRRAPLYRPVSRFPSADVDLAFVVDDAVAAAGVEASLRQAAGALLEDLWLFDVFRGPQLGDRRRSLAYRLRFAALDHTLAEDELGQLRQRCIERVEADHAARLRE